MKTSICIGLLLLAASLSPAQTTNLTALLQQGLFEEQASRNLDAAITDYQTLAAQFDKDRQLAATAVFRLGECYRAQGNTNQAAVQYRRILRDFSDQSTLATLSRQNLAGMDMDKPEYVKAEIPVAVENPEAQLLKKLETKSEADLEKLLPTLMPDTTLDALLKQRYEIQVQRALLAVDYATNNINVARADASLERLDVQIREKIAGMMQALKLRADMAPMASASKRADLPDLSVPASSEEDQEIARIQQMIQNSPDLINAMNGGSTPLVKAAYNGWLKVAAFLLDHGADVNVSCLRIPNNTDFANEYTACVTPLVAAVAAGNKAMTGFLLARGADIKFKGQNGNTPLHLAAQKKFQTVTETLLAGHADVNARNNSGATPLFSAVQGGQLKIIQMLLAAGADANLRDDKGRTVLNYAINTSPGLFKALLDAGTNPNTVDSDGRTPLSYAAERDSAEVVKLLLTAKADPNGDKIATPLVSAINKKDLVSAEMLLQAGADPNAQGTVQISSGGSYPPVTPLLLAISKGQHPMVQLLLKYKADPDGSQIAGQPLLFSALSDTNILESLLAAGAKVDAPNSSELVLNNTTPRNHTALHDAVYRNPDAVEVLLRHGANPNARDALGMTPLHCARWNAGSATSRKVYELLLAYKADPNVRDRDGQTPLDLLKRLGAPAPGQPNSSEKTKLPGELADLLRQHGALDELPDFTRIRITRQGLSSSIEVFKKASTLTNQFTLLETVMRFYARSSVAVSGVGTRDAYQALPFPDFGRIIIHRPGQKIGKEQEINVNLLNQSNIVDCARDVPVQFGDVIEIPESVHALNATPPNVVYRLEGHYSSAADKINIEPYRPAAERLQKSVQLLVAGETATMKVDSWDSGFLSEALNRIDARSILRTSSDLSRVKVTRKTGKSASPVAFTLDLSQNDNPFWLQDGDVIEVPQKQ